jgi:hypothetical protein
MSERKDKADRRPEQQTGMPGGPRGSRGMMPGGPRQPINKEAAARLGVSERTLYRKIKEYGL